MRDESWRCVKVSLAFYQAGGYYVDIFFHIILLVTSPLAKLLMDALSGPDNRD